MASPVSEASMEIPAAHMTDESTPSTPSSFSSFSTFSSFSPPSQLNSLFFNLPAELRLKIYSYCIPQKCAIKVINTKYRPWGVQPVVSTRDPALAKDKFANTQPHWINILQVCKRMTEECLELLYGENLFEVHLSKGGETALMETFSQRNLQRIRNVLAVAPSRWFIGKLGQPDVDLWATIGSNLTRFEWVVQPDWICKRRHDKPVPLEQLEQWFEWTDTYLDCFSEFMPAGMKFKLGFDNWKGDQMYRNVGGVLFKRGPFFKKGGEAL
jgi:hypothetical protein